MTLVKIDLSKSRPQKEFKPGLSIKVSDKMQKEYSYVLTEPLGKNFAENFKPALTPDEMLEYGVFEGKYLNDCFKEFPKEWYEKAFNADTLSVDRPDMSKNYFNIKSRQPLKVWLDKSWILSGDPDIRGWFQWYCRYYIGRRESEIDERQIKRWRAFNRHAGQVYANCRPKDLSCRPRQRQALLQWSYNPFV